MKSRGPGHEASMKLVILDRDGKWVPVPGALEAIARLNHAGWHTVVATNQSGLARGLFDMATLNAIHERMNRELAMVGGRIDAVFFCPHGPDEGCACRKPQSGLFSMIGERYGVDLRETYVVGDSMGDLEAGAAVGCAPHLVLTGKGARLDDAALGQVMAGLPHAVVHADLAEFAHELIQRERHARGEPDEADSSFSKLDS